MGIQKKIKDIFTMVLKGHIGVATFNLDKNTTGNKIDKVARAPLKSKGKDYSIMAATARYNVSD